MRLLGYELKKMLRRPLTLVVLAGAAAMVVFVFVMSFGNELSLAWGPDIYGSAEAVPEKERYYTEGVVRYTGFEAVAMEKERAAAFEGAWDDARLRQLAGEYQAFLNDPGTYTDEPDTDMMMFRRWNLMSTGMSEADVDAYDAENPIYVMQPEKLWGEWQSWGQLSALMDTYVIDGSGDIRSFEEAFPGVAQPANYSYHTGPETVVNFQGGLFGILLAIMVMAGCAPLFCEEVTRGTEPMLLASKYGRGRLAATKLAAGLLYTLGCVVLITLLALLASGLFYGFDGLDMPVQLAYSTHNIPYTLTFGQLILATAGLELVGGLCFAGIVMALSAVMNSAFPVLFLSAVLLIADSMLAAYADKPFNLVAQALPAGPLLPNALLYGGQAKALGVLPVSQMSFCIAVCLLITALLCAFVVARYRRKR